MAVEITELPPGAILALRAGAEDGARAALALGMPALPTTGLVTAAGDVSVLGLAPDEWLILGEPGAEPALLERFAGGEALAVAVSDAFAAWRLTGPAASALLAHGCALDLDERVFTPGRCVRTLLGRVEAILERRATPPSGFDILVDISHAAYFRAWLAQVRGLLENGG